MKQEQILLLLSLQNDMNSKVDDEWLNRHNAWHRAITTECSELIDHHGWKWWKSQLCDLPQVQIEIIDILHFGLSLLIQESMDLIGDVENLHDFFNSTPEMLEARLGNIANLVEIKAGNVVPLADSAIEAGVPPIIAYAEVVQLSALRDNSFNIPAFFQLAKAAGMDSDELVKQYLAKNCLNFFRQDNGYKEGSYVKMWNGEEDNVVLARLMDEIFAADAVVGSIPSLIAIGLEAAYSQLPEVLAMRSAE